jgi:hypothetical protein
MPTGTLVFQGNMASLLNNGAPCTAEAGATGDRWCGFFTPFGSYPGDLYVVNVTQAAAGASITCGVTDANCLHLTSGFTQDDLDPNQPPVHPAQFQGDTLIYYDATWTPFAWRPGMTAARALAVADPTTMDVALCTADLKGTAVMCLRALPAAMQTDTTLLLADLLAGKVDGTADPPLARVETVIAVNTADTNVSHFQYDFPIPGSGTIAWSSRATKAGPEVLKTQTIGNDASRATVASNVNSWSVSPDGMRWYWLSAVNATSGAGTLQGAPYPAGTAPTTILANTSQYTFPTNASLVTIDTAKNLRVVADPVGAPTAATSLDTGVLGLIRLSAQGHIAYAKAATMSGNAVLTNVFVKKSDGTGACTVDAATNNYLQGFFFSPDSGGATWLQIGTSAVVAQYTRLSDCTTTAVDSNGGVVFALPLGNRGVLLWDGYDSASQTGALQLRNVGAGNAPSADPLAMVSGQVGSFATAASGAADIVVYTVNGGGTGDGVYVRGFGP